MLTQEQINKMIEEEKARLLIKAELEKPKKENKYFVFFNSNLGIFILSTIVVSFLTWAYAQISTSLKEKGENKAKAKMLSAELKKRTAIIESTIPGQLNYDDLRQLNVVFTGDIANTIPYGGPLYNGNYYTYKQYSETGVDEMVSEISRLTDDINYEKTNKAYSEAFGLYMSLKRFSMDSAHTTRGVRGIVVELPEEEKIRFEQEIKPNLFH